MAVEGEVATPREYRYVLVNKPRGVASTRSDPHAERVLVDMVPDGRILFPVGRLDLDTTGLIILTNDGVLANRLMHPRYGVTKTYSARVRGHAGKRALAELRSGIELEDGRTAPAEARVEKQSNKSTLVELTIHEGRKHQVRRMLAALGLPVEELHRRRYGPLSDKNLKIGAWRALSGDEVEALRRAAEEVERNLAGDDPGEAVDLAAPASGPARDHDAPPPEHDSAPQERRPAARGRRRFGSRRRGRDRGRRVAAHTGASGVGRPLYWLSASAARTEAPVSDEQRPRLRALRGATTVDADTRDDIKARTEELLTELLDRNGLAVDDIVSILFTATPDLRSDFPAAAARALGLSHTPLLCAQEIPVEGAMSRCIRVLMHCYRWPDEAAHHVYLHEARQLRLDLPS